MLGSSAPSPEGVRLGLQSGDLDLNEHVDSVQAHFESIEPKILAFIRKRKRFSRIRKQVKSLKRQYPSSKSRPLLFGMMFGVKDIFNAEGFRTRAGSQISPRVLTGKEAKSVTQLRDAGALVLGKTVTTEFAYFAPGPTRNPHNPEHTPGGSSSGSAAAVAAGLVPVALGTQTIGSVIRPASFCGTVGFKPSYDRISREGVIPLSPSLDHVGVFAADALTVSKVASVLCSGWRANTTASNRPTVAIPEGIYLSKAEPEMLKHFFHVIGKMKQAGFRVKRINAMPDFDEIVSRHNLILSAEAAHVHKDWYRLYNQRYHARTAELIERGNVIGPESLNRARKEAKHFSQSLRTLMDLHGIDLWIAPSATGPAPHGLDKTGDPIMNLPWTQAGLPVLGLPTGKANNGLPLGTQLIADHYKDEELLAWAMEIERILRDSK